MFKKNCYEGGKRHNFSPRFTEVKNHMGDFEAKGISANEFRRLLIHEEYIHDICEWCGKIIKKEQ